ncbi:MAG: TrmH family RNA methyltransferase [Eubacteriales bacterium]
MAEIRIFSKNAEYQLLEVLKSNRNKRHKKGWFVVEGVKSINLAASRGWDIKGFVHSHERELSGWGRGMLESFPQAVRYILTKQLIDEYSDREDSSELVALVGMKHPRLEDITFRDIPLVAVFERPQNPGNLGSVIRSAASLGADALIVTGHAADIYDPVTVRSSIGTLFTIPVLQMEGYKSLLPLFERISTDYGSCQTVGTSAKGWVTLDGVDFKRPTVLFIGNESDGLSQSCKEGCEVLATIPMGGAASSLNAACAASICLYEAGRQRQL